MQRIRGSGRLLDLIPIRLAIAEEGPRQNDGDADSRFYVINGVCRNGIDPLILERDSEEWNFRIHEDLDFIAHNLFASASRQLELYILLREKSPHIFRFSQVEALKDGNGKPFHKKTITNMLKKAAASSLLRQNQDKTYE